MSTIKKAIEGTKLTAKEQEALKPILWLIKKHNAESGSIETLRIRNLIKSISPVRPAAPIDRPPSFEPRLTKRQEVK